LAALASADDPHSDNVRRERNARRRAETEAFSRVSAAALRLTFYPAIAHEMEIIRQLSLRNKRQQFHFTARRHSSGLAALKAQPSNHLASSRNQGNSKRRTNSSARLQV
jgi:hypothetical protein